MVRLLPVSVGVSAGAGLCACLSLCACLGSSARGTCILVAGAGAFSYPQCGPSCANSSVCWCMPVRIVCVMRAGVSEDLGDVGVCLCERDVFI